jgi:hypothetical protein
MDNDKPLSRADLQNLRSTLEVKRLQDVTVQQFVIEITSEVIAMASAAERKRQYTRREWKLIGMTKEIQEGICAGLRQKFPDCSVYFLPADTDARRTPLSTSYSAYPMLIVDWS